MSRRNKPKQLDRKVWIVNDGGHDFSKAEVYGTLHRITDGQVNPFGTDRLAKRISKAISLAHEDDYVLVSGTPVITGLVLFLWLSYFPRCNLLQFDARAPARDYQLTPVERDHLLTVLENAITR
jgi:hypothetical protein